MKLDVNICNKVKSIRTRLGMSQQELANIAGVTRQTIGGVESGQYAPSVAIDFPLGNREPGSGSRMPSKSKSHNRLAARKS